MRIVICGQSNRSADETRTIGALMVCKLCMQTDTILGLNCFTSEETKQGGRCYLCLLTILEPMMEMKEPSVSSINPLFLR